MSYAEINIVREELRGIITETSELKAISEEAFSQGDTANGYRMQKRATECNVHAVVPGEMLRQLIREAED